MNHRIKLAFFRPFIVFCTLGLIALVHAPFIEMNLWLIGCFGAAAVLISVDPLGYMARPKAIGVSLIMSSAIGLAAAALIPDKTIAILVGCALAMAMMVLLDVEHPPGGAAAFIAASGGYDVSYLLAPVLTGTAVVIAMRYVSLYIKNHYLRGDTMVYSNVGRALSIEDLSNDIPRLFNLLDAVTESSQESEKLEDAIRAALEKMCEFTQWPLGHAYIVRDQNGEATAESLRLWHIASSVNTSDIADFKTISEGTSFTPGKGLIGKVLQSKEPVTIADVTQLAGFVRAEGAKRNNVKGCFAFPVVYNAQVRIVLEFFSHSPAELDDETLRVLQFIGKQLCFVLVSMEHKTQIKKIADEFEHGVQNIANQSNESVLVLGNASKKLSSSFKQVVDHTQKGSKNAHITRDNVESITQSVHNMSRAINEVSQKIAEANRLTQDCVEQVKMANGKSDHLQAASEEVRVALHYVMEIAKQTNLLALNATIEAARAGEMGRSFAVVAGEVKALATKSNEATKKIQGIVENMAVATKEITEALHATNASASQISAASSAIAVAVEEQSTVTQNIAENMQKASQATVEVSEGLTEIQQAVDTSSNETKALDDEALSMEEQMKRLTKSVADFLTSIRKHA